MGNREKNNLFLIFKLIHVVPAFFSQKAPKSCSKKLKNTSYGIQTAISRPSKSFSSGFLRQPRVSCAGSHKSEHDCDTIIRRPLKHKCYAIKFYTGGPGRLGIRFFFFLSPSLQARMISIWAPLLTITHARESKHRTRVLLAASTWLEKAGTKEAVEPYERDDGGNKNHPLLLVRLKHATRWWQFLKCLRGFVFGE